MKLPEAESEGIYEEYNGEYEKYGDEYAEYISEGKRKVLKGVNVDRIEIGEKNGDEDKNGQEGIYEQYDGDYEKYISKNGKRSKSSNPNRGIILQKLGKNKCWLLLGILLLSIVGIVVGLSVHFTATDQATTRTPVPLLIATTTSPLSTATATEGSGQNNLLTLRTTTIKATSTVSSLTSGENGSSLVQCINSCGNDRDCEAKCVNEFKCQDQPVDCSISQTTTSAKTTSTIKTISLQITSTSKSTTTTTSTISITTTTTSTKTSLTTSTGSTTTTSTKTTPTTTTPTTTSASTTTTTTTLTTTTTTSTSTTTTPTTTSTSTTTTTTTLTTTTTTTSTSTTTTSTVSTITTARPTNMDPNRNAVLVLSTFRSNNKPLIVDFNGNVNEDLNFEYGEEIMVYGGCGALLRNVVWYFGGCFSSTDRHVIKIVGCKMERQTPLNFNFASGACSTFTEPDPKILLCFDWINNKECHTFDGESYQSAGSSTYSHKGTTGLPNYRGRALTTGCYGSSTCGVKTELMDMNTLTWSIGPDYPFTSIQIRAYSTASTSDAAYIIGGANTPGIIAQFKNDAWSQSGTLAKGRAFHGSISLGNEFMVIGGLSSDGGDLETEIWQFTNGNNKTTNPTLGHGIYAQGIGLYVVPFDFCT